jgi:hypothetical protein
LDKKLKSHNKARQPRSLRSLDSLVVAPFVHHQELKMNVPEESYLLHVKAWREYDKTKSHLNSAYSLLLEAYEGGDQSSVVINNLAAVLLDMYRDKEALDFIKEHKPECKEFCLNYAIALVKQNVSDINEVRKWNKMAANYPKQEHAIVAYMDWQGL